MQLKGADIGAVGARGARVWNRGEIDRPRRAALVGEKSKAPALVDQRTAQGWRHRRCGTAVGLERAQQGILFDLVTG